MPFSLSVDTLRQKLRDRTRRSRSGAGERLPHLIKSSNPQPGLEDLRAQSDEACVECESSQQTLPGLPPRPEAREVQLIKSRSATNVTLTATSIIDEISAEPIQALLAPANTQHSHLFHSASTGDLPQLDASTEENAGAAAAPAHTINYELAKLWVRHCEENHGDKCSRRELNPMHVNEVEIILIDVRRKCLVTATTAFRYFALSYVWGSVSQLQTQRSNFDSLTAHHALQRHKHAIPKVIKDAMQAVSLLGETHLWVDSLCIIQDDATAKHHQIANMARIYSSAVLTIVAVAARDANSSLPGVVPGTRWPRSWNSGQCQLNRPLRPDLVLKAIDRSLYVSRGWTFQERHLSKRCLYFLDEQIYFQCRTELWCEEPPLNMWVLPRLALDSKKLDFGLNIMTRAPEWAENIRQKEWDRAFAFYAEIILEYSWKRLSYPYDIIDAFSGVLDALEQYSGWTFLNGLPDALFDYALLWAPADITERRPPPPGQPKYYFPSWSWCGWIGGVDFNVIFDFALQDLRSCVEKLGHRYGNSSSLLPVRRSITGIWHEILEGVICRYVTATSYQDTRPETQLPLDLETDQTLGHFLNLDVEMIKAESFEFEDMPSWWRDTVSTPFADKRATNIQRGVWIRRKGMSTVGGLLFGIDLSSLEQFSQSSLWFALLSQSTKAGGICFEKEGISNDKKAQHDYREWMNGDGERWKIYNVILMQGVWDADMSLYYYERVAIGQLNRGTWDTGNPKEETIWLG